MNPYEDVLKRKGRCGARHGAWSLSPRGTLPVLASAGSVLRTEVRLSTWLVAVATAFATAALAVAQTPEAEPAAPPSAAVVTGADPVIRAPAVAGATAQVSASANESDVAAVYAALSQQRIALGLESLNRDQRLERAAAKLVADSVAKGYFDLASPGGRTLQQWVTAEEYPLGRVSGKIAEANLRLDEIAAGWPANAERNRESLFNPQMRDAGVGVARIGSRNRVIIVLGITETDFVSERAQLLLDADQIEAQFGVELNALRAQAGRKPMSAHPALRQAAAELAGEVLEFQLDPNDRRRSFSMARRIRNAGYRMREALELQAVGPTSVEELVEFWFRDAASQEVLLRRFFTEFGLAVDVGETEDGLTIIWVLSVGRPGPV